jgi:hypothetical protein
LVKLYVAFLSFGLDNNSHLNWRTMYLTKKFKTMKLKIRWDDKSKSIGWGERRLVLLINSFIHVDTSLCHKDFRESRLHSFSNNNCSKFCQTFQVIVFSFQGPFSAYFSGRPSNERVLIFLQIRFRRIFTGILEFILVHLACLIQYYLKRKKKY